MMFTKYLSKNNFKRSIIATVFSLFILLTSTGQIISNPTVLNSMTLTNVTPVSATLNWMYWDNELQSAPSYIIYSRTSSETLYTFLAGITLNFISASQSIQSKSINVTGLQPNTTYTWFLGVQDEALGFSEPLLMPNYNTGKFIGYSFLTTATYQYLTFTTPNTDGTGGAPAVVTTVSGNSIPVNQPPIANAGTDITLGSPVNSTTLNGLGSTDGDGGIQSYTWSKVGGPAGITLNTINQYSPAPALSNLVQGTYTYRLVVIDSRGDFAQDFVNVIVDGGGVNQLPSAFAGVDKVFTPPPANSLATVTLSGSGADSDGFITNYLWTKISGPASFIITNPTANSTTVSNLVRGTYLFQLTVTDNRGGIASDVVSITLNSDITPAGCTNDNFESNNTSATAAGITAGSAIQAKICPLTDVDFFRFNNRNNRTNVRVTLFNLPTNYVLELFAPNGNVAGTSSAGTQNKVIVFNTTTVGTYRIKVSAGNGAALTNNSYSLLAEISRNSFAQASATAARQSGGATETEALKNERIPSAFHIYPNPAKGVVNLTLPADELNSNLSIFNLSGQLVKTARAQKNLTTIKVHDLEPGVYLLKVITASGKLFSRKIIISR